MKKAILILIFSCAIMSSAMAWGILGHRSIAEVAERHLTPAAKANIEKYTKGTPLASYAIWMDEVRKYDPHHANATRGWHASVVDEQCKTSQAIRNKYRKGRDTVTGLLELEKMLENRENLSDSVVMFAIKSIVHMVADMHCPAHLRYSDYRNDGKFRIKFYGSDTTLHKIWDTSILTREHKGWSYEKYATKLDTASKGEIKRISKGWVEDWLEESGRIIRPHIYKVCAGDELGDEFMGWAYPLAESQARKSGYRLAKYLNKVFR